MTAYVLNMSHEQELVHKAFQKEQEKLLVVFPHGSLLTVRKPFGLPESPNTAEDYSSADFSRKSFSLHSQLVFINSMVRANKVYKSKTVHELAFLCPDNGRVYLFAGSDIHWFDEYFLKVM